MSSLRSSQDRTNQRKKQFKQTTDAEASRRKRDEQNIQIRKSKREESLAKRRKDTKETEEEEKTNNSSEQQLKVSQLPSLITNLGSNDLPTLIDATQKIRKLLSIERNPPIQECVDAGIVVRLVEFLNFSHAPKLQFEAAWAITNIASGSTEQTLHVIRSNALPLFVTLLRSPAPEVKEQAVWGVANISGESTECRDYVLNSGALEPLIDCLSESNAGVTMLRTATWALSNLCRGKPQPEWKKVSKALPTLSRLIYSADEEVLTDACWALSYLSDGSNDRLQQVLNSGVSRRMVELLNHSALPVQTPALRTVGNLVTGDEMQTQVVLNNHSVLPALRELLGASKKSLKKEACWAISNIAAGSKAQIQAVIDAALIPPLVTLCTTGDFEVRKEAAWALSNVTSGNVPDQIRRVVRCGVIEPFCNLLECPDARTIVVALEGIENILKVGHADSKGTGLNPYADQVEQYGGLDKIEQLQNHKNSDIYEIAVRILERYFNASEENQCQNVAPQATAQQFTFGVPTTQNTPANSTYSF